MACTFAYRVFAAPQLGYWQANRKCSQDGARLIVFKVRVGLVVVIIVF